MSARFLALLLKETNGKADQALAGYYQGLRSLRAIGMYTDTKQYVRGDPRPAQVVRPVACRGAVSARET